MLEDEPEGLSVGEIYDRVVQLLDDPAPRRDYVSAVLAQRSGGKLRLFVKVGYGVFRLVEASSADRFDRPRSLP
jgi:hypothetical protein